MKPLKHFISIAVATILLSSACAFGQAYPAKPVRLIVPYGPGTATDTISRLLGQKLSELWGQNVIVENVTGAGGVIGTQALAKASPDGYTLGMVSSNHTCNAAIYSKLPYDSIKDFKPVVHVSSNDFVFAVSPSLPVKSVKELIAFANANPSKIYYGSGGNGSSPHFATEKFSHMAGIKMTHVPYKTMGQALTDLLSGRISFLTTSTSILLPYIKAGKLRGIAVTGSKRSPLLPDLPTLEEAGVPGYEMKNWNGILAPAGTPDAIVSKIYADVAGIFRRKDIAGQLAAQGIEVELMRSEDFAVQIANEISMWSTVARGSAMKAE